MKSLSSAALLAAAALGFAAPAPAQANLLAAPRIACTAVSATTCEAPGKCKTEPATDRDKGEVLLMDFAAKTASIRKAGKVEKLADILEDKISGEVRAIVLGEAGKDTDKIAATLAKDGKFTMMLDKDGSKAEATCKIE